MRRPLPLFVLVTVALLGPSACSRELHHDLTEAQANEILVLLDANGVPADKAREPSHEGRWRVEVPADQTSDSLRILQTAGLPRRDVGVQDPLAERSSLIPLAGEERLRVATTTGRRLESSLMAVDGVVDARVHLVLPDVPRLVTARRPDAHAKASVLVKVRPTHRDALDEARVRTLVAGGVEGLAPQDVSAVIVEEALPTLPDVGALPWSDLGPFRVATASRAPLQWAFGGMLLVILAQSIAVGVLVLRLRRPRAAA